MDFDSNRGKARLSERLYRVYDDGDDADLEVPVKFIRSTGDGTDRWWALVQGGASAIDDGLLFKTTGTDPLTGWTQDAITDTSTDCVDDIETFGEVTSAGRDRLVVARDTDLAFPVSTWWISDWWTSASYLNQSALAAANPHPLHKFINLLMVADGNVLHTIDDSFVVANSRITLPKQYQIIWIEDDGFRIYLGTRHSRGGEALVFPWDGTSTTYDTPLSVNDSISLAGRADAEGVMHTINGKGQLMAYNGQDFVEVAALPIAENDLLRWAPDQARGQRIHPNGISLIDGKINILIDGRDSNGNLIENMHSGIWEYDKEVGLYHKYSLGQYKTTNNEWGTSRLIIPGALIETREDKGKILAGAELYIDAGTTKLETIMALVAESNQRGYFITPQIHSTSIRSFWQRLNLAFKKFENTTDKIIVKYRIEKDKNFIGTNGIANSFTITWSDTDTFTSTGAVLAYAEVGDEIEITTGKGAGACAHISSISEAGGTYTVNLDETIPNASGTAYASIQNWIKLGEISDNSLQKTLFKITKRSKWIQFKCELRGGQMSPEFEELGLEFNTSKR